VGRINADVSVWLSKCMDQEIAQFEGFVVDCPPTLTVGCDLLLEIRAYLLRSAFPSSLSQGISFANDNSMAGNWRAETTESEEEKKLRERKVSLVRLFRACTLRASMSNDVLKGHQSNEDLGSDAMMEQYGGEDSVLASSAVKKASPKPSSATVKAEIIDITDGVDSERIDPEARRSTTPDVDDGTELNENQIDNVYSKAQLHDTSLPEVEPAEGFALTLRPYQKQALGWMLKMEEKDSSKKKGNDGNSEIDGASRRELSLHPLWEEYRFPVDDERMDLLDTAAPAFYFK
jgi:DNA repair protein RAD5